MDAFRVGKEQDYSARLYINKYKPKKLIEFTGNEHIKQTFISYIETNTIPNILLIGEHGCGKSLLVKLFLEEYFRTNNMTDGCIEIYGSLNRGKDAVSDAPNVKNKMKYINSPNIIHFIKKATNLPKDKLKIIVVYEFHQMSSEAQMAFRRVMELYSNKARFIFLTDDPSLIIQALQSRCTPLLMHKLTNEEIDEIILPIIKKENFTMNKAIKNLIKINADGDIRVAINLLQILGGGQHQQLTEEKDKQKENSKENPKENPENPLSLQDCYSILGIPEYKCIEEIIDNCIKKNSIIVYKLCKKLISQGFDISDIIDSFLKILINYPSFPQKDDFLKILSSSMITIEDCYTETQLYNFFNKLCCNEIQTT